MCRRPRFSAAELPRRAAVRRIAGLPAETHIASSKTPVRRCRHERPPRSLSQATEGRQADRRGRKIRMMIDIDASGVYIIAATPFTDDGAVDSASVDRLMDFYIGCGISGITVLGIMGEAPKLTHAESVALTRQVVRRANGLPVVVGASAPGFASMGALAKDVMDAGAGGVMIAPPSTLKTDDQIVTYYANAVEAIGA